MQQGESAAEAEHIIVVGAGPAGLAVSLGLYRYSMHGTPHVFDHPLASSVRQEIAPPVGCFVQGVNRSEH
jgi:hypothetical protein